jgi:hypothetical protein
MIPTGANRQLKDFRSVAMFPLKGLITFSFLCSIEFFLFSIYICSVMNYNIERGKNENTISYRWLCA